MDKDLYVLSESNYDLQTNDPIHERKKKLFSGPSGTVVNKAKILTAMAIADARHDHTNQKGYLTYLMCEKQDSGIINNVKKRKEPKNFKEATEDNCLEAIFGKWPTDGSEDMTYFNLKTDGTPDNKLRPSHSLKNIRNKYHIAIIGTDKSKDEWDDDINGSVNRAQGWINMATLFKRFLQTINLKSQNILYHCDAANLGWDHLKDILAPDGVSPFLMQTRASLTDPATKITEKTQDWLRFRHDPNNTNKWGFLREKPDTKLATSVVNSYVYNEVKDCNDNSVNESWLDTLVSKQKVTHKLEDYDNAYIKLEKKNRSDGTTKTIYYDGFLSAKKIGATDIVLRNKNLYHNDITKVISGSHALAKRCGDWCQAIQTKREFKKANYEEYNGNTDTFIEAGSEAGYDISENSVIQCLITHDRILKAYALTIGVPMVILTKQKREQIGIGPSMEIYIDRSYSSRKTQLQNKFDFIRTKFLSLLHEINSKAAQIDTRKATLKEKAREIKRDISGVCIETKNLISATQLNGLNDPEEIKKLLSSGKDNFYYKFIVNIATLYHVLSTYTTAIVEIDNLPGDVRGDLKARLDTDRLAFINKFNEQNQKLELVDENDGDATTTLDNIEGHISNFNIFIGKVQNELSILNLAEAGLNNDKFNEIKNSVSIFTNDEKIAWCSPFKFLKRYGSIVSLSCLTTSIPRKLCIEYIRKLTFIKSQLKKIFTDPQMNTLLLSPNNTIFKIYSNPAYVTNIVHNGVDNFSPNPPDQFSLGIFFDYDSRNPIYFNRRRRTNLSQYILLFNSVVSKEYSDALGIPLSGGGKVNKENIIQRGGAITMEAIEFSNNIASYMIIQRGYDKLEEYFVKTITRFQEKSFYEYLIDMYIGIINNHIPNNVEPIQLDSYGGFLHFLQFIGRDFFNDIVRTLLLTNSNTQLLIKNSEKELYENILNNPDNFNRIYKKVCKRGENRNPRGLNVLTDLVKENSRQLQTLNAFNSDTHLRRFTVDTKINIASDKISFLLSYLYTNAVERIFTKMIVSSSCHDEEDKNLIYIMEPTIRTDYKSKESQKIAIQQLTRSVETAEALLTPESCDAASCTLLIKDNENDFNILTKIIDDYFRALDKSILNNEYLIDIINGFFKKGYIPKKYAQKAFKGPKRLVKLFSDMTELQLIKCQEWVEGNIKFEETHQKKIKLRTVPFQTIRNGWKYQFNPYEGIYFVLSETGMEQQSAAAANWKKKSAASKKGWDNRNKKTFDKAAAITNNTLLNYYTPQPPSDRRPSGIAGPLSQRSSIQLPTPREGEYRRKRAKTEDNTKELNELVSSMEVSNSNDEDSDEYLGSDESLGSDVSLGGGGRRKRKTKHRRKKKKKTRRKNKRKKKTKRRRKKKKKTRRKR